MTDDTTPAAAPGASRLSALSDAGYSTDEVNQYRDRTSGQLSAAGFTQQEINNYWGIKTPDTSGVERAAAAAPQQAGALTPDNPAMRAELVGSYARGETKNPNEFVDAALRSVVTTLAGAIHRAQHPIDSLKAGLGEAGEAADEVGNAIEQTGARYVGTIAYPFLSSENQQKLEKSGMVPPPGGEPAPEGTAPAARALHAFEQGVSGTLGTALSAPYLAVSAPTAPLFNKAIQTVQKATPSPYATVVPDIIDLAMNMLGVKGIEHVGTATPTPKPAPQFAEGAGPWGQAPKAQDFPDAAIAINGNKAEAEVAAVLRNIYAEQGIHPAQVAADAKADPSIAQDLAAGKTPAAYVPPAPAPAEPIPKENATPLPASAAETKQAGGSVYQTFSPDELTLDAKRFQYKASEEGGVTGALQGVKKWEPALANPVTVWQSEDGKTYVVNGHQRFDLARRAAASGQEDVQMPARVYREADGYTPDYMRTLGAYQNIAEGSGTPVDAAKVLRSGALPADRQLPELPPKSQLVQQAHGLAALDEEAFGMVVNDIVPPGYAAEVGHAIRDPKEQLAAMDVLAKSPPANLAQARMMVQDIKNSGFLRGDQTSLFGDTQIAQSLFSERSRILENAVRQLRQLKTAFGTALNQEGALTEAGNKLSREANQNAKATNETLIAKLETDATRKGEISNALSDAARQLKSGQSVAAATRDFIARARELAARAGDEGIRPGDTSGRAEPQKPAGQQSEIPGAGRITDRELAERKMEGALRAGKPQESPDEGLFDVAGRGQGALFQRPPAVKSPFDTASAQPRALPENNYTGPLSTHAPVMFREASVSNALELMPSRVYTDVGEVHLADDPDMALGQKDNKGGVLLAFDTSNLRGKINLDKPALAFSYERGMGEYIARQNPQSAYRNALVAVRVPKDMKLSKVDKAMLTTTLADLERAGWQKIDGGDYVEYQRQGNFQAAQGDKMDAVRAAVQQADGLVENPRHLEEGRQADASIVNGDVVQYQARSKSKATLFRLAEKNKDGYAAWIKEITDGIKGAEPYSEGEGGESGVRVKKREGRIDEKIEEKGSNAGAVSDYLGGAIEVASPKALEQVLARIGASDKKILEVEDMLTSDDKEKNDGYRAMHMQVELEPGFSAELQLLPKSVAKIKETLHPLYAKLRDAADTKAADAARQKMIDEYQSAFSKFIGAVPQEAVRVTPEVAIVPKTRFTAKEYDIATAVNAEAQRLFGGKVITHVPEGVYSTGVAGEAGQVRGYTYYTPGEVRQLIYVAMQEKPEALETARHEVGHLLFRELTDEEKQVLEDAARKEGWVSKHKAVADHENLDESGKLEEAIVEEFAQRRHDQFVGVNEKVRPIFQKISDFLDAIADKVRRILGKKATVNDIFSRMESGEVGNRGGAGGNGGGYFQTPEEKILEKISIGESGKQTKRLTWDSFYTAAVDRLDPVRRIVDAMQQGNKTAVLNDTYKLMRNLAGNYGRAQHFLEQGTYDFNTYQKTGKSLKEIIEPVKDNVNGLRAYAAARRAIELEDRGIKSGMPVAEAKQVIASGAAKYEPIFKELNAYQEAVLKYLKDSGVLTDDQVNAMRGANKAYVPFYRVMDGENYGLPGGAKVKNPIKRIKGSERDIIDPIESIVRNTYSYITIAERNAAAKSFHDLASQQPNPEDYFTKQKPLIRPTKVTEQEMEKFLKSQGITQLPQDTLTVFRAMRTPLAKNEIGFFDNGKWTVLKVEPDLAEAFHGTPRPLHGWLFKMIAAPAKMLRYGIIEPAFILRHLERNTLSATVIGSKAKIPFENLYKGIFSYINKDEWYENWLKSGGKVSALSGVTRDDVQDQMHRITQEAPEANFLNKAWNIVKTPFDVIHAVQQSLENINRLGAYKTALQGLTTDKANIIDAGYYSRNIAPDPARIGRNTSLWNAVTALANTEVQHTAQLIDAFKTRPIPTLAKGFAFITLPTIINWAFNHNSDQYKEAAAWERDAFWIMPVGGYGLRIPKPFFLGFLFGTVPERMLDALLGNDPHGKGLEEMLKDMFEQASPNTIPTALTPIMEQITNHSMFRDMPLVPEHLMEQLPEYRYSEYTSELTKAIGRLVGYVPYVGRTSMASPIVIDNYLRAWTGAMGTYVKEAMDFSLRKAGVLPDPMLPANKLADLPFVRAFVTRYPSAQAESIQRFHDDYMQMSQVVNSYKALIKQGDVQRARDLAVNNPTAFAKLDTINRTLNEQNQLVRAIYKNPSIRPDEKRQLIDATYYQMIQVARAGNNLMDALQAPHARAAAK